METIKKILFTILILCPPLAIIFLILDIPLIVAIIVLTASAIGLILIVWLGLEAIWG